MNPLILIPAVVGAFAVGAVCGFIIGVYIITMKE